VARDLGMAEPPRASLEQLLRLRLRGELGGGIDLGGMADVCERDTGAGVAEDASERERIVVPS
jgi:hypothetical protein